MEQIPFISGDIRAIRTRTLKRYIHARLWRKGAATLTYTL